MSQFNTHVFIFKSVWLRGKFDHFTTMNKFSVKASQSYESFYEFALRSFVNFNPDQGT